MNQIAALLRRIWQTIVRWFTETCIIADPVEKAKRDAQRRKEKELAKIQAKLDSGRYEAVARWRKVKRARKYLPWFWRRSGHVLRAINPRRRRAKRILAEHGVNYNSGRQRRRFRKTYNRAYRAHQVEVTAAANAATAPVVTLPGAAVPELAAA
ncbi:MAG: hypothetical protein WEA80_01790 [Gemmatimonadaceae bacterium]